jgi:universal stress protein E
MHILAATDFSTRSNRAVRQAGLLAQPGNSQLHIVHVVDDDQPEELVSIEKREAQRLLDEQIGSMPELTGVDTRPVVVAGLIVMGSHRKHFLALRLLC